MRQLRPPFYALSRSGGFSMIELLTTVGIIAVLASIVIPALGKTTEKGRAAKCVSNLKQWGAVTMAYVADNDGALPTNGSSIWYARLWPYVFPNSTITPDVPSTPGYFPPEWKGTIYECPSMMKTDSNTSAYRSYGFNLRAGDMTTSTPDKLATILRPSSTALIGDCKAANDLGITTINARHEGICNVVYMDGHVGSMKVDSTLTDNYFDAFWGVTRYENRWK